MHPSRLARILAAALLVALMLPQSTLAATTTTTLPSIRLSCALVVPNPLSTTWPNRAIVCRWAAPDGVSVARYRLWRTVDGGARELVTSVRADARLRHADFNIRSGKTYRYTVVGYGADGSRVAKSAIARVYVPSAPQALWFNCVVILDAGDESVRCAWSDTTRASALRYVLYRSVHGGAREAIYRVHEDGRRSFRDWDVKPGQSIRYAVVALDASGRIVAWGGPDRVVIPD